MMRKVAGSARWCIAALSLLAGVGLAASAGQAQAVTIQELNPALTNTGHPNHIAIGPGGNVWFIGHLEASIDRITPEGVLSEFFLTPFSSPEGVTAGPEGNVWFTETYAKRIGQVTPAGVVELPSQGISGEPEGITTGPDGNVWFTERGGKIGRITPGGVVSEFSTGITGTGLYGIAQGPDGDLWFTEASPARIGRITPDGVVSEFSAGITPGSEPNDITAGPDGNLWFTERRGNRIGRITPGGVVTEFSAGITPGSEPLEITAGPDGNLWFTEPAANRIGRITPGGVVSEFSEGITGREPGGIIAGSEGNLWFTERSGQIGRVTPAATEPAGRCDLYASTAGSDSNPGTQLLPLRTTKALIEHLSAGQAGCLASGQVFNETEVDIRRGQSHGAEGAPVTITSTDPEVPATIDGRVVTFPGANWITFAHLRLVFNGTGSGGLPSPTVGSAHTSWTYDEVTGEGTDMICFNTINDPTYGTAEDTLIEHDRIHDCGVPFISVEDSGYHDHGIYDLGIRTTIRNDYIYGNSSKGVLLRGGKGAVVEHNVIDGNSSGVLFGDMTPEGDTFAWNIVTGSGPAFCAICGDNYGLWTYGGIGPGNSAKHNDFFGNRSGMIAPGVGSLLTLESNVEVDPQYTNAFVHDYTLEPTSPLLGFGPDTAQPR
jgi:streptogramin lyase